MERTFIWKDFKKEIDRDEMMRVLRCKPESPAYDEIIRTYEKIEQTVASILEPLYILFTEIKWEGSPHWFCVKTLGDKITRYCAGQIENGRYLEAVIASSMADAYLFSMDKQVENRLRVLCEQEGVGIAAWQEIPQDLPFALAQQLIGEEPVFREYGIEINGYGVLKPEKSVSHAFRIEKGADSFCIAHSCTKCGRKDCYMRKKEIITVQVKRENQILTLKQEAGVCLLETLRNSKVAVPANCGGLGTCGKCRIKIETGEMPVSAADERFFSKVELQDGWRLACTAYPVSDVTLTASGTEEGHMQSVGTADTDDDVMEESDASCGIGVDLGTTTLAMVLYEKGSKRIVRSYSGTNHQRIHGADVIARVQASIDARGKLLQRLIREDLLEGIHDLCAGLQEISQLKDITIAGNTTMVHLLMGYDCTGLGSYPFHSDHLEGIAGNGESVLGSREIQCPVMVMPGFAAFIGGDIFSGLYALKFHHKEKISLLVDLGTNGEMVIGNRDLMIATSVAAGPAFEGGNISSGMASVPGAVCQASIENGQLRVKTIGDEVPIGICGTGVIEIISEMIAAGWIDENGTLDEVFDGQVKAAENAGGEAIFFTQKDIREFQMAKAAVRAGIETLLEHIQADPDEVEVYLAGGLGYYLDPAKAIRTGLFPPAFAGHLHKAGNSSLNGTVLFGEEPEPERIREQMRALVSEINLAEDAGFQDRYLAHMFFET